MLTLITIRHVVFPRPEVGFPRCGTIAQPARGVGCLCDRGADGAVIENRSPLSRYGYVGWGGIRVVPVGQAPAAQSGVRESCATRGQPRGLARWPARVG